MKKLLERITRLRAETRLGPLLEERVRRLLRRGAQEPAEAEAADPHDDVKDRPDVQPKNPDGPNGAPPRVPPVLLQFLTLKERVRRMLRPGAQEPPRDKPEDGPTANPEPVAPAPVPAPPPELPLFFMLSHLDDDGPVRLDGVKLGVCEAMGLEIDEPKLGAFAGALNALDFPVQLLIRQHPPRLGQLREKLREAQPEDLPPQTEAAAESLGRLLTELETRDGILDRRFYAVCEFARIDDLRGLLSRAGLSIHPLRGRQLRMFFVSALLGGSPADVDEDATVEAEINRRDMRVDGTLVRSLHLGKWPRSLAPVFCRA